jgi:hypothetical protein
VKSVTLIDDPLVILHGGLGSTFPGAWSRVLVRHFGGDERIWFRAMIGSPLSADAPGIYDVNGPIRAPDLETWHAIRSRYFEQVFKRVRHDLPLLNETILSPAALKTLEREAGQECRMGSNSERLNAMSQLSQRGQHFAIVSQEIPAELLRGMLDNENVISPVIGPEELGQVGLDGMAWETLAHIAGADPATSRFITKMDIDGWPIRHPYYDYAWKLYLDFKHSFDFRYEKRKKFRRSKDRAVTESAQQRLAAYAGQDFGTDFRAWKRWLDGLFKPSKNQWLTLLRDDMP